MSYVMGFVAAVPVANKDVYRQFAEETVDYFKGLGATRLVEAWGDEVPRGENTDFYRAVAAKENEVIVYSFQVFPDKATADAANEKMSSDAEMADFGDRMPFDGTRMIYGGFEVLSELTGAGVTSYLEGSVIAVPNDQRDAYAAHADTLSKLFVEHGAVRSVNAWGDLVPDGKVTDFKRAVAAKPDEAVVFSWIEWPSKQVRDTAWGKLIKDPRLQQPANGLAFDEGRRIYGSFIPILDA